MERSNRKSNLKQLVDEFFLYNFCGSCTSLVPFRLRDYLLMAPKMLNVLHFDTKLVVTIDSRQQRGCLISSWRIMEQWKKFGKRRICELKFRLVVGSNPGTTDFESRQVLGFFSFYTFFSNCLSILTQSAIYLVPGLHLYL